MAANQSINRGAFVALIVGLVAVSASPIFIRLSEMEISPYATIFHRSWMATAIFAALLLIPNNSSVGTALLDSDTNSIKQQLRKPRSRSLQWLLLGFGLTFTAAVISWAWALTKTTVANSSLLHSSIPIFTGLLGWLFLGQRFRPSFWVGMAIATTGAILLGIEDFQFNPEQIWGDSVSLLSAVFFSVDPLLVEQLRQRLSSSTILFYGFSMVTLLSFPLVLCFPETALPTSLNGWLTLLAMTIICQVVGHGLLTYALKDITAGIVSLCHLLVPILSAAEAWWVFGEALSKLSILTFVTVLAGIIISLRGVNKSTIEVTNQANEDPLAGSLES
ncbi:MAG: DMT family transporter [Symploca sp. SIO1B1]|nr:DMT family transporter [Symploca sp. SIO1A3]NER94972.1 DMT family transporter [Symploca sp. SIO1B1]